MLFRGRDLLGENDHEERDELREAITDSFRNTQLTDYEWWRSQFDKNERPSADEWWRVYLRKTKVNITYQFVDNLSSSELKRAMKLIIGVQCLGELVGSCYELMTDREWLTLKVLRITGKGSRKSFTKECLYYKLLHLMMRSKRRK